VSGFQVFCGGVLGVHFTDSNAQVERRLLIAVGRTVAGLAPICRAWRVVHRSFTSIAPGSLAPQF